MPFPFILEPQKFTSIILRFAHWRMYNCKPNRGIALESRTECDLQHPFTSAKILHLSDVIELVPHTGTARIPIVLQDTSTWLCMNWSQLQISLNRVQHASTASMNAKIVNSSCEVWKIQRQSITTYRNQNLLCQTLTVHRLQDSP